MLMKLHKHIAVALLGLGAATAVLCQRITKGRDLVALLKVHLAFISKASMHPIRINEALREKLKVYKK